MDEQAESELRNAIVATQAERVKHRTAFRAVSPELERVRRETGDSVAEFLKESGLDLDKLKTLQGQRTVELERLFAEDKSEALRLAARNGNRRRSGLAEQIDALRGLVTRTPFLYPTFVLDTPLIIWSEPLMPISSTSEPGGSWVKFRLASSADKGDQAVSFFFYWVNTYNDYAVIDVSTALSATGYLRAHASWPGWGFSPNAKWVQAVASLGLWRGVSGEDVFIDSTYLGGAGALSNLFLGGDANATTINVGVPLSTTMFAVPPVSTVVFEVAIIIDYGDDSGNIEADFESGDFQVICPGVVVSLLHQPSA